MMADLMVIVSFALSVTIYKICAYKIKFKFNLENGEIQEIKNRFAPFSLKFYNTDSFLNFSYLATYVYSKDNTATRGP